MVVSSKLVRVDIGTFDELLASVLRLALSLGARQVNHRELAGAHLVSIAIVSIAIVSIAIVSVAMGLAMGLGSTGGAPPWPRDP